MKDLIKTPEIKPKKKILPYIFKKPSSLKNEKDKIQEICKKLYGHKVSLTCTKYKTVKKILEIQESRNNKMAAHVLEYQLKQLTILTEFNKTKSSTEYNFYKKLKNVLTTHIKINILMLL